MPNVFSNYFKDDESKYVRGDEAAIVRSAPAVFNNVADAKAGNLASGGTVNLEVGRAAITLGYYSANDGGGGDYRVVSGGTGVDDGGSYHDMTNGNQLELRPINDLSACVFGVKPDGTTDNQGQLNAFKEYLKTSPHKTGVLPAGIIGLSGTFDLDDASGLNIKGQGGGGIFSDGTLSAAVTTIKRIGASAGPVLRLASSVGADRKSTGGSITGIAFDGGGSANNAVEVVSVNNWTLYDLCADNFQQVGFLFTTQDLMISGVAGDIQQMKVDQIFCNTTAANSKGMYITGVSDGGNTSQNEFGQIHMQLAENTDGLVFGFSDSNTVGYFRAFSLISSTADRGLVFEGDPTNSNLHARDNLVIHCATGRAGVFAENGGGIKASEQNAITFYNFDNNGIDTQPIVEAGASLIVGTPFGTFRSGGPVLAMNASGWANLWSQVPSNIQDIGDESLRIVNNSGKHSTWENGSTQFKIDITAFGQLQIKGTANATSVLLDKELIMTGQTLTPSGVSGGTAQTLPSNPQGYLVLNVNGGIKKIPYYN